MRDPSRLKYGPDISAFTRGTYSKGPKQSMTISKKMSSSPVRNGLTVSPGISGSPWRPHSSRIAQGNKRASELGMAAGPVVEPGPRRGPSEPKIVGSNPTGPALPFFPGLMPIDQVFGGFQNCQQR